WINDKVELIPRLKNWVATYYPGLQTAITEYNWGAEGDMNGATTQADIWGIFGREGLDMATRWTTPASGSPAYLAMKLYRNYDGSKSSFGETSVSASVANPDNVSAFASQRTSDGALTVMVINKYLSGTTPVTVNVANFSGTGTAQVWQLANGAISQLGNATVSGGSLSFTAPPKSVTLFVLPAGGSIAVPAAPTNLAVVSGNGSVSLTWTASTGAASYNVKRSTVSGGPYSTVGTSTNASYADNSVTNGSAYYYVVTAVNAAGESGNSNQASATPAAAVLSISSGPSASTGKTSATIKWSTNIAASSVVQFGKTSSLGSTASSATLVTSHSISLGSLSRRTKYYYTVSSTANGSTVTSAVLTFTTS
ncbi:MAG: cellulase, partial [Chloroflexi bacterium]|nr:cellulase [Chloroflexota bacterium]